MRPAYDYLQKIVKLFIPGSKPPFLFQVMPDLD